MAEDEKVSPETPEDFLKMAEGHLKKAQAAKVLGDDTAAETHLRAQLARLNQAVEAELARIEDTKKKGQ